MGKSKSKKSGSGLGPEAREMVAKAAEELLGLLPVDEPGPVFESVLKTLPGLEGELVEALAGGKSETVLEFLVRLSALPLDKKLLKALRRAVYRLEQAGLKVPDEARPQGQSILRKPAERAPMAFLSGYDPDGARMGLLALPAVPSGYDTAMFVAHEQAGLTEFLGMQISAGEVRRLLRDLGREFVLPPVEMPPGVVRLVMNEAAALARRQGHPIPEDYEWFAGLAASVASTAGPGIYQVLDADEVRARVDLARHGPNLLAHPAMHSLFFYEEIVPYLEQLSEVESSVLVLSDGQKQERYQSIVDKAAREIISGDRKNLFKRQLEEVALYLWQSGETETAETALAAALDLEGEVVSGGGYDFSHEVVLMTFEAGLQFMEYEDEPEDEASDIQKTGTGLIIPGQDRD